MSFNMTTSQLRILAASNLVQRYTQYSRVKLIQMLEDKNVNWQSLQLRKLTEEYNIPSIWELRRQTLIKSLEKSMSSSRNN